ncbi:hypothetical protein [Mesorhizobium sp. STM 4661]|uniref:TOTE conflict system archaeo-eukaryotic primase domain-containing protein n=1 Tax=Mesorhizobium sp. STM 4661 TaxID=1297570 RepID=UPI0018DED88A|nr:hypothetical protein [Mesorhizobium sp. STM 4661]
MIEKHLRGADSLRPSTNDFVAGVYPLLPDETCWFIAADFDEENWAADALAICSKRAVPKGCPPPLSVLDPAMEVPSGFSLARMAAKRRTGYRSLGYTVESPASTINVS